MSDMVVEGVSNRGDMPVQEKKQLKTSSPEASSKDKQFPCEVCGKCFQNKGNLLRHCHTHMDEKLFVCEVCGKCFRERADLRQHSIVHAKENFQCDLCGKFYTSRTNLRLYLCDLSGQRRLRCNACKKGQKDPLKQYSREMKEKPFQCEKCGKRFSNKGHFAQHSVVHTRTLRCTFCDKCFNRRNDLTRHLVVHTKEKPYHCDLCDKSYTQRSSLEKHYLIHLNKGMLQKS